MKIIGTVTVGDTTFGRDIDLTGLNEKQQIEEIKDYLLGLGYTIMEHLQLGVYKDDRLESLR